MEIDKYKEEIYKCSGCGQCQSACPVYKTLKTECAVSRGKFKLLNAIINKDAKFSHRTLEIMDLCLHCNKCSGFCPSEIDAQKIIETAQFDMLNCGIFNSPKLFVARTLANKKLMRIVKFFINVVRNFKLLELINIFNCPNNKLARNFLKINVKKRNADLETNKTIKVLYFKGCINSYINPSSQNAVKNILQNTQAEITEALFNCCGLPLKTAGDFENFRKVIKENLKITKEKVFNYLVFDCTSCKSTFLGYANFLEGEEKEYAQKLSEKIISIYELLDKISYTPKAATKKITVHYPCHTCQKEIAAVKKLIKNFNFVECENADSCCGAAGSFLFTNNKISKEISEEKAQGIINSGATTVLTTCPSCVLGLKQGLISKKSDVEVLLLTEFLGK